MRPFHLAFPVDNVKESAEFYTRCFNCQLGRQAERWVDLDFFGHQLSLHLNINKDANTDITTPVDGDTIHVPHFGVILEKAEWQQLQDKLKSEGVTFILEPKIRFAGQAGEQGTFFIKDPSNNTLEFKYFDRKSDIFATE
jgi:extradiol dioxygenase family protein